MRTLFFLLLFINLAFAVYIQLEPVGGSAAPPAWELQPEKIKLLPALPAPAPAWNGEPSLKQIWNGLRQRLPAMNWTTS